MAATRTAPARNKCIPAGAAAAGEKLRIITRRAKPAVRRFGLPFAQRTADAAEIGQV